ncbi:hypothetical protein SAMN05216345_11082 [Cupriavidus sp. YR651]|uniref:hypothetical protein n=1 Tax=Cupriavidus sp. YR651 TaxID=1855315 RepID=UPI0008876A52|nr:hypothetical protein [Cupriavidus sp. YR651]SDD51124.1 hypothetical protein SAMN05216345_11082 [Cupriavidus sp. YR651]
MKQRYLILGLILAAAAGAAQAQSPARTGKFDTYTDGARDKYNPYSDGAHTGKFDAYTDGARTDSVNSLNPGVRTDQFEPIDNAKGTAQKYDNFSQGMRSSGTFDTYGEGAKSEKFNPFSDGANKE